MKTVKQKDGWWIEDVLECDIIGPYNTKKEAEDDRRGLERTEKNMNKRTFWTCEKETQTLTPVVFRSKEDSLFALFPEEAIDNNVEHCKCYSLLLEGYASANYKKSMQDSKAATKKESEKILAILKKLGWKNLKIIKRASSIMHKKRLGGNQ